MPSNVILLDKFIAVDIDGISIGSNDLTQLTLGINRDSSKLPLLSTSATRLSIEKVVRGYKVGGVTFSICG